MDPLKPNAGSGKGQDAVVAVDLGGTNLRVALVDRELHILRRHEEPSRPEMGAPAILDRLGLIAQELLRPGSLAVQGVGFSLAGIVDTQRGVVHQCPNLPGWEDMPLQAELEQRLKRPVVLGNDANLAALAEARALSGRTECLLYITVSTGVGGGVVYQGKAFLGGRGLGPEVGHIVVQADGPPCACGGHGCLEAMASGSAIAREARDAVQREPAGALASLARQGRTLDARTVAEIAEGGDAAARRILERAGWYLGMGLSSLAHAFGPNVIVVGGGVSLAGELLLGPARGAFVAQTMDAYAAGVAIIPAAHGDDSSLLGAACAAWEERGS